MLDQARGDGNGPRGCEGFEMATTIGAVIVHGNDEFLAVGDWFALVAEIANPMVGWINQVSVQVKAGRVGWIDLVFDAKNHIKIVPGNVWIDEGRFLGSGLDLMKETSRHFQPVAQLRTGHDEPVQFVGKDMQIRNMA